MTCRFVDDRCIFCNQTTPHCVAHGKCGICGDCGVCGLQISHSASPAKLANPVGLPGRDATGMGAGSSVEPAPFNSTYHAQGAVIPTVVHATQAASRESGRHSEHSDLDGAQKRNGCVAKTDMPRTEAAAPADESRASAEFSLEHLAHVTDEGQTGWNQQQLNNIARTMQRIAAEGEYRGTLTESLIATVEEVMA